MRQEQARVDGPVRVPKDATPIVAQAIRNTHFARQESQGELRKAMALWAGWQHMQGRDAAEIQRRFFYKFGRDVLTAQTLGASDATELQARVAADLAQHNIIEAT
jgi:hypothetical protein